MLEERATKTFAESEPDSVTRGLHVVEAGARPRCTKCDVVIGVFEPMVAVLDGAAFATSLAARPEIGFAHGTLFHEACHANG